MVKTTREQLAKYDKASIITNNEGAIKDAIRAIGDQHVIEHAVFKLLCKFDVEAQRVIPRTASLLLLYDLVQRYVAFVHQLLDHPSTGSSLANVAIPNGLNIVMNEVITTVSLFLRLITYNKMVFSEHYDRILSRLQSASSNQ